MDSEQLESLRSQYEHQVTSLRHELAGERTAEGATVRQESSETSQAGVVQPEAAEKKTRFQLELDSLRAELDARLRPKFDLLRPKLEVAHQKDLENAAKEHASELSARMEEMRRDLIGRCEDGVDDLQRELEAQAAMQACLEEEFASRFEAEHQLRLQLEARLAGESSAEPPCWSGESPESLREMFACEMKALQAEHAAELQSVRQEATQKEEQLTVECERLLEELRACDAAAEVAGNETVVRIDEAEPRRRSSDLNVSAERHRLRRSSELSAGSEIERHVLEAMIEQLESELTEREAELALRQKVSPEIERQLSSARDELTRSMGLADELTEKLNDREIEYEEHVTMLKRQISVHSDAAEEMHSELEKVRASMREEHNTQLADLRRHLVAEHEATLAAAERRFTDESARLLESHRIAMSELSANCERQSAVLLKCQSDHQAALADLRTEHAAELEQLHSQRSEGLVAERRTALAEAGLKHEMEVAQLLAEQREELQVSLASLQKELTEQKTKEISDFASELEAAHQLAIDTLTKQWRERVTASESKMAEESESRLREERECWSREKERLVADGERNISLEVEKAKNELSKLHAEQLSAAARNAQLTTERLEEGHRLKIAEMEAGHQVARDVDRAEHDRAMSDLQMKLADLEKQSKAMVESESHRLSELEQLRIELETTKTDLTQATVDNETSREQLRHEVEQQKDRELEEKIQEIGEQFEQSLEQELTEQAKELQKQFEEKSCETIQKLKSEFSEKEKNFEEHLTQLRAELQQQLEKDVEQREATVRQKYEQQIAEAEQRIKELETELTTKNEEFDEHLRVEMETAKEKDVEVMRQEMEEHKEKEISEKVELLSRDIETSKEKELSERIEILRREIFESSEKEQCEQMESWRKEQEQTKKQEMESLRTELMQSKEAEMAEQTALLEQRAAEKMEEAKVEWEEETERRIEDVRKEMEEENEAEVAEVRDSLMQEIAALRQSVEAIGEEKEASRREREEQLALERERKDARTTEMEARIAELTVELEQQTKVIEEYKQRLSSLETEAARHEEQQKALAAEDELLAARRAREDQERHNLVSMLQADVERLNAEREKTTSTNEQLLRVLSEAVRANSSAEQRISRRLADESADQPPGGRPTTGDSTRTAAVSDDSGLSKGAAAMGSPEAQMPCRDVPEEDDEEDDTSKAHETSVMSVFSDEGLDLSQRVCDSIFTGPELNPNVEELVVDRIILEKLLAAADTGRRLQTAIDRLLDLAYDSSQQGAQLRDSQRALEAAEEDVRMERERVSALRAELDAKLTTENESRDAVASQLNDAQATIQGYTSELTQAAERVRVLEDEKEEAIAELARAKQRLTELEGARSSLSAREAALKRQQAAMDESTDEQSKGLLHENTRLAEEKFALEQHYDVDRSTAERRIAELDGLLQECEARCEKVSEQRRCEVDDLQRHLEANNAQLAANRKFLEEQSLERETERDELHQLRVKLQEKGRDSEKSAVREQRLEQEVSELEEQLRERSERLDELERETSELTRSSEQQTASNERLRDSVRQLEAEVEMREGREEALKQQVESLQEELARRVAASPVKSAALADQTATIDDLTRSVCDLEAEVATLKRAEQLALERVRELEEGMENLKSLEEELTQDKAALQKQVYDHLTEISTLKTQVDELKVMSGQASGGATEELQRLLAEERDALENRTKEISDLTEQLEQFREQTLEKEDTIQQMAAQIEIADKERQHQVAALRENIDALTREKQQLEAEIELLQLQTASSSMPVFAQELLDEKNREIDELHDRLSSLETADQGDLKKHDDDDEIQKLTDELSSAHLDYQRYRDEKEAEVTSLQGRLDEMENAHKEVSGSLTAHQEELQATVSHLTQERDQLLERVEQLEVNARSTSDNVLTAAQAKFEQEVASLRQSNEELRSNEIRQEDEMKMKQDQSEELVASLQSELASRKVALAEAERHLEMERESWALRENELQEELDSALAAQTQGGATEEDVQKKLVALREQLLHDWSVETTRNREQREAEHLAEMDELRRELVREHSEEIRRLTDGHQQQLRRLQSTGEHDDSLVEIAKNVHREVDENEVIDGRMVGYLSATAGRRLSLRSASIQTQEEPMPVAAAPQSPHPTATGVGVDERLAWEEERTAATEAVRTLKELLAAVNTQAGDGGTDAQTDVLRAVRNVFSSERQLLLAQLTSYAASHSGDSTLQEIELLRQRVKDQEQHHTESIESLLEANTQTMSNEIDTLKRDLAATKSSQNAELAAITASRNATEEELLNREAELKRQVELQTFRLSQEAAISADLRDQLASLGEADGGRRLSQAHAQLARLTDALEKEQSRLVTASVTLEQMLSALEAERKRNSELEASLVSERQSASRYIEQLEVERLERVQDRSHTDQLMEKLRQEFDVEHERHLAVTAELEAERAMVSRLQHALAAETERGHASVARAHEQIAKLGAALKTQSLRRKEMRSALQQERELSAQLQELLDEERTGQRDASEREGATVADLHSLLDLERSRVEQAEVALEKERGLKAALQSRVEDLTRSAQFRESSLEALRSDRDRLQASLLAASEREVTRESQRESELAESTRLRNAVSELERRLAAITKQKLDDADKENRQNDVASPRQVSILRQKLQQLAARLQDQLSKSITSTASTRLRQDQSLAASSSELQAINVGVKSVLRELQTLPTDSSNQTETTSESDRLPIERAQWMRERADLTLRLHEAERALVLSKADVRRAEIELERERERLSAPPVSAVSTDTDKMRRLYGRYLKTESFRKSLVYQKRYLLLLLAGYHHSEHDTLAVIGRMAGPPAHRTASYLSAQSSSGRPRAAYTRFRSAVRTVIAISRLKLLVRKWHRATRIGSTAVAGSVSSLVANSYVPVSLYTPRQLRETSDAHTSFATPLLHPSSNRWQHMTPPSRDDGAKNGRIRHTLASLNPSVTSPRSATSDDANDVRDDYNHQPTIHAIRSASLSALGTRRTTSKSWR